LFWNNSLQVATATYMSAYVVTLLLVYNMLKTYISVANYKNFKILHLKLKF